MRLFPFRDPEFCIKFTVRIQSHLSVVRKNRFWPHCVPAGRPVYHVPLPESDFTGITITKIINRIFLITINKFT